MDLTVADRGRRRTREAFPPPIRISVANRCTLRKEDLITHAFKYLIRQLLKIGSKQNHSSCILKIRGCRG